MYRKLKLQLLPLSWFLLSLGPLSFSLVNVYGQTAPTTNSLDLNDYMPTDEQYDQAYDLYQRYSTDPCTNYEMYRTQDAMNKFMECSDIAYQDVAYTMANTNGLASLATDTNLLQVSRCLSEYSMGIPFSNQCILLMTQFNQATMSTEENIVYHLARLIANDPSSYCACTDKIRIVDVQCQRLGITDMMLYIEKMCDNIRDLTKEDVDQIMYEMQQDYPELSAHVVQVSDKVIKEIYPDVSTSASASTSTTTTSSASSTSTTTNQIPLSSSTTTTKANIESTNIMNTNEKEQKSSQVGRGYYYEKYIGSNNDRSKRRLQTMRQYLRPTSSSSSSSTTTTTTTTTPTNGRNIGNNRNPINPYSAGFSCYSNFISLCETIENKRACIENNLILGNIDNQCVELLFSSPRLIPDATYYNRQEELNNMYREYQGNPDLHRQSFENYYMDSMMERNEGGYFNVMQGGVDQNMPTNDKVNEENHFDGSYNDEMEKRFHLRENENNMASSGNLEENGRSRYENDYYRVEYYMDLLDLCSNEMMRLCHHATNTDMFYGCIMNAFNTGQLSDVCSGTMFHSHVTGFD